MKMKTWKRVIQTAFLLLLAGCAVAVFKPGVITIHAQSLPIQKTLAWDANAASEQVTHYLVTLDGVAVGGQVVCSTPECSIPITITRAGQQTVTVRAVNMWSESPAAVLNLDVKVPSSPKNTKVKG